MSDTTSSPSTRASLATRARNYIKSYFSVFRYSGHALSLVWSTSRTLSILYGILTLVAGLLPAATAVVGKWIVDGVLHAAETGLPADQWEALTYVVLEGGIVASIAASQRGLRVCDSLLRAQLGHRVNVMILEKALTLELTQFEDAEFYDKMTRARREASSRPLSLVRRTFGLIQNVISLVTYGALLLGFSGWAVVVLVVAAVPAFIAETRFAGEAFRLFRWRAPESREQMYLETVIAREDFAKEVQLFQLGETLLDRYKAIFKKVYSEDRSLTLRRGAWGYVLGLMSTLAFYGAYGWIALVTILGRITLGEMTMYLLLFKQGQSAFATMLTAIGGMYEDNLYLSNLYEFLEQPAPPGLGSEDQGPKALDGIRFENVAFTYPGATRPALSGVTLHLKPGRKLALVGKNGSGKTTLIKLLTRLYTPSEGRILLDGRDLQEWEEDALRQRIGVIFQDFVRYQLKVGENIGVGDVGHLEEHTKWTEAAQKGMADEFISSMPDGYDTQLGRWFKNGQELSGGQWQKIALSRAFMRSQADIIVLDEPTAAMDAEAEAQIFEHFRKSTANQMAILISHRFSTVRMADEIIVLEDGKVVEQGTHEELMTQGDRYAHLFELQAAGYQ